ncbi:hypothetical protein [Pseudomonas fluorescens]|uniref:Uncharacterized protein n=1 Tax=Pseudomonas fluorescens TaxID=294 RepID=A0A5E7ECV7_PSEFL|nr:hypothetical protein [Pseudomonas fluorescens]VVO24590.1 hypothetical protein PS710_04522 [Pseudomonas fluorescens]
MNINTPIKALVRNLAIAPVAGDVQRPAAFPCKWLAFTRTGIAVPLIAMLGACSSLPSDSSGSNDVLEMVGAMLGVAAGSVTTYQTGSVSQGQSVMESFWSAVGFGESDLGTGGETDFYTPSSGSASDDVMSSINTLAATATGSSSGMGSAGGQSARSSRFSFTSANCPSDMEGLRQYLTTAETKSDPAFFSRTAVDMVSQAGSSDIAIAELAAQSESYREQLVVAEQAASDTDSGMGGGCSEASGIHCSSKHASDLFNDGIIANDYAKAVVMCNKAAGIVQ